MVHSQSERLQNIEKRLEVLTKKAIHRQNQNTKDLFIDDEEFQYIMAFCPNTAKDWRREGLVAYTQKDGKFFYTIEAVKEMLVEQFGFLKKKQKPTIIFRCLLKCLSTPRNLVIKKTCVFFFF